MSKTVLCVLLKVLMLARADTLSNGRNSDLQDITVSKNNNYHILQNLKSDQSHPDNVRNKINEILFANMSMIPESIERILGKPTSPRAFVQFDNGFLHEKGISITFRWNQPNFTDEVIQGYIVQCWFVENQKKIQICDNKSISATILECTVHNLKPNTTYYFQVRAHTKIGASPYTDLINVSTTHENPIPQLLMVTSRRIDIWDLDSNTRVNFINNEIATSVTYSIVEHKIYWIRSYKTLMMLEMNENKIIKIINLNIFAENLCIDWVARNLYWIELSKITLDYNIMKLDLTMWENGIVKYDKILEARSFSRNIGTLYWTNYTEKNEAHIMQSDLDGKNARIFQRNISICPFRVNIVDFLFMEIDDINIKNPLIYWLFYDFLIVTDINVSICKFYIQREKIKDIDLFCFLAIDKTNIYISEKFSDVIYVLEKKYLLENVDPYKYIQKIKMSTWIKHIYAFGKSLQPYPPTRCLTPDQKVYNVRILMVTTNSIIINLPELVHKNGCKNNLPSILYTINISYRLGDELNKFDNFTVQTYERYYEIQNLTRTEYKLLVRASNFYFDQLSMEPLFDSEIIVMMRTKPKKLDAPENVTVEALTPTIAAIYWMPPKTLNMPVIYEVHLVCDNLFENKVVIIDKAEHTRNGIFFKIIEELTPGQNYTIYVRIYPVNCSDYYNNSLSKTLYMYSEPNDIMLRETSITSMIISWIPSVNLTIDYVLEYKNIEIIQEWQIANNFKLYGIEVMYHIKELPPETRHEFRLRLRYPKYEKDYIWPSDGRFNFSTLPISSALSKLRAFVEFYNGFPNKKDGISVILRWNQPKFIDEVIQGYTVQYWFIENQKKIQICNENISATILEYTVHNLKPNTTYSFQVRARNKSGADLYTDLIDVSTTHENPIPQLLMVTKEGIDIWDLDSKINVNFVKDKREIYVTYSITEHKIYWNNYKQLMMLEMNENKITKIMEFKSYAHNLCIDWITKNLYWIESDKDSIHYIHNIMKLDLTMWENGILKYDKISEIRSFYNLTFLNILPSKGILYWASYTGEKAHCQIMQSDLDGKNARIFQKNISICPFTVDNMLSLRLMQIDDINNKKPLIYWLFEKFLFVTDINVSICKFYIQREKISNHILHYFKSLAIDKTNIYIHMTFNNDIYVLEKKYALLESVDPYKYIQKIKMSTETDHIYAFGKSLQPYPPTRCLTPDRKVYNIEILMVTTNSIIINLPELVHKNGCKNNLPSTLYTINISYRLDNELNKFDNFTVQTYERYYEIQNLTLTEYKLLLVRTSNFYSDQLSMEPLFDSEVIVMMRTKPKKLDSPENVTVEALTPTIAEVCWMPPKTLNMPVIYEVHLMYNNKLFENTVFIIEKVEHMRNGIFFKIIEELTPEQNYTIYVRIYPVNFSDYYNDSLSKILYMYSEPNNIILSKTSITSMNISWIPSVNVVYYLLEYKNIEIIQEWQIAKNYEVNNGRKVEYYIKNLLPGTRYKFRLILKYSKYEKNFTWPSDGRFTFSTLTSDISSSSGYSVVTQYIIPNLVAMVIVILICCIYYMYRQCKEDNEHVFPPIMTDIELAILHEIPSSNIQSNRLYSPMLQYNSDEYVPTKIKREEIRLEKLLGSGEFGKVFRGTVKNLEKPGIETPAAIKMTRENASSKEKKKFLEEAKLMNHFRHKHVLRLLAVCLDKDSPLIVLELMEVGDLLQYLRYSRKLQPSDSQALRLQDLFAMCEDVARGCCYLENLRFVHRDLACRNCLVSARDRENRVIKIGDFGLAKDVYKDDYYRVKGQGRLPVCWMAPESLVVGIFTSQSDVWSFGVVMWEITSLGERPYTGRDNLEVIDYVRAGGRLSIPLNCPPTLYELMLRCWNPANDRPNFKHCLQNIIALRNNIEDILLSPVDIM